MTETHKYEEYENTELLCDLVQSFKADLEDDIEQVVRETNRYSPIDLNGMIDSFVKTKDYDRGKLVLEMIKYNENSKSMFKIFLRYPYNVNPRNKEQLNKYVDDAFKSHLREIANNEHSIS